MRLMPTSLRHAGAILLVASVALATTSATPARAAAPPAWSAFATDVGISWIDQQNASGTFRDYVYGGRVSFCLKLRCAPGLGNARYGESALGYAMILSGVRTGNRRLSDAGLRAIDFVVRRRDLQRRLPTNFESLAVAAAYNVARRRLSRRSLFAGQRHRWVSWMRAVKPQWVGSERPYFNHTLVEALSNLELFRTGVTSRAKGAVLNPRERPRLARLTRRVLNREIPAVARQTGHSSRGARGEVLSDRPDYPLGYHGFSLGLYARAIELLGPRASGAAKATLRRLADASWLLAGPDGDVAYTGRSQEDVWALPSTAFGAEYVAHMSSTSSAAAARYEAVADRTVERMRTAYGIGPSGLWIVPALTVDPVAGLRGIDAYAGAAAFGGLALMELEWAIAASTGSRAPGAVAADSEGAAGILTGDDSTALVRSGDLWYAVRQASSITKHQSDLRYDFGLVALKQLRDGSWRDVQPLRPTTSGEQATSAGPLLVLRTAGGVGIPYGSRIAVGADRATTVSGGFKAPRPSLRWLRRGVRFRFEPVACGMRLTFPVRAGDSVEYSAFMRGTKRSVTIADGSVADAGHTVSYDTPARVTLEGGYASGADPRLVRARLRFEPDAARTVGITVCSK